MTKRTTPITPEMLSGEYVLYRALDENERQALADIGQLRAVENHHYLFHQHSPADKVYNVYSGIAMVERLSASGRRQILGFIFPGDFVGLTHSDHFEYSVKSLTHATFSEFPRQQLLQLSESAPNLKNNVKQISANVLAHALDQIYVLGQKKARERLCFLFVQLLERMPGARPEQIDLPMTRLDIADYLGLTIETVSRSFAKLKKDGLIATPSPQRLQILDLDQTREQASAE